MPKGWRVHAFQGLQHGRELGLQLDVILQHRHHARPALDHVGEHRPLAETGGDRAVVEVEPVLATGLDMLLLKRQVAPVDGPMQLVIDAQALQPGLHPLTPLGRAFGIHHHDLHGILLLLRCVLPYGFAQIAPSVGR